MLSKNNILFVVLATLGAVSRLVPHGWNFTAIGAVALVSGLLISNRKLAILTPLVALFLSDLFIGFHNTMIYVYGAYALVAVLGILFSAQAQFKNVVLSSVAGSLAFFFISNFGVWAEGTGAVLMYAKTFSGLIECYTMGVPFFRNQFLSDLILTPILFYSLQYAKVHFLNLNSLSLRKRA